MDVDALMKAVDLVLPVAEIIDPEAAKIVLREPAPTNAELVDAVDRLRVAREKAAEIIALLSTQGETQ